MDRPLHKVFVFKFHPSSHSEDYTMVATYKSQRVAEKVCRAVERLLKDMKEHDYNVYSVDWDPNEAHVHAWGNKVSFGVYTAGYLDDVESVLKKVGIPTNFEEYRDYQEFVLRVKIPKGLSIEVAALVLDRDEAEVLRWFIKNCGKPEVEDDGEHQTLKWNYSGDGIYSESEDSLYVLGEPFSLYERDNWEVEW